MLLVVVCLDGAGSACWGRTKDQRGHASVPDGGDGRSGGQPLARALSLVVPARVPSRGAAPPMLYSLRWRRCPLGQQGCVPVQRLTLLCRAVAKLTVNPLSFLPFKCTLPSSGTRSTWAMLDLISSYFGALITKIHYRACGFCCLLGDWEFTSPPLQTNGMQPASQPFF